MSVTRFFAASAALLVVALAASPVHAQRRPGGGRFFRDNEGPGFDFRRYFPPPSEQPATDEPAPAVEKLPKVAARSDLKAASDAASRLYAEASSGIVRIRSANAEGTSWLGTGFLIGTMGVVVTNYHIIEGASQGQVAVGDDIRPIVGVLAWDARQDVALVKIDPEGLKLQPLKLAKAVPVAGSNVVAAGHRTSFADALNEGTVRSIASGPDLRKAVPDADASMGDEATEWVLCSAPTSPGNSGGPLLSAGGEVVGVLTWSRAAGQKLQCAASVTKLLAMIDKAEFTATPLVDVALKEKATRPSVNVPVDNEFDVGWASDRRFSRSEITDAMAKYSRTAKCQRCNGSGSVSGKPCADCKGTGASWTETTADQLGRLAERILLADRKTFPADSFDRVVALARAAFHDGAVDSLEAANRCNNSVGGIASPSTARGRPTVFFGDVLASFPLGDKTVLVVQPVGGQQVVLVRSSERSNVSPGTHCLVGGLYAASVAVPTDKGLLVRESGVEAFTIQPLR